MGVHNNRHEQCEQHNRNIRLYAAGSRQTTLEHVETCLFLVDQVAEFAFHQLAVVVRDEVLEGILVSLLALALVSPGLVAPALDRHALKYKLRNEDLDAKFRGFSYVGSLLVALVGVLERVGNVVLVGALVYVQFH